MSAWLWRLSYWCQFIILIDPTGHLFHTIEINSKWKNRSSKPILLKKIVLLLLLNSMICISIKCDEKQSFLWPSVYTIFSLSLGACFFQNNLNTDNFQVFYFLFEFKFDITYSVFCYLLSFMNWTRFVYTICEYIVLWLWTRFMQFYASSLNDSLNKAKCVEFPIKNFT